MIVLDTNVVLALMSDHTAATVASWLDRCPPDSIWITTVTIFEIRFGIETLAHGSRRRQLESGFARVLAEDIEERVLQFDDAAADAAALIAAKRQRVGRIGELRDTLIAGIVVSRHADLATRNVRHFQDLGVRVIDPWAA
jgi:predicted nucleic acid-binding protein